MSELRKVSEVIEDIKYKMKMIPDSLFGINDTISKELGVEIKDFTNMNCCEKHLLPVINGKKEKGVHERIIHLEQSFGGLWYVQIIGLPKRQVATKIARNAFPKPMAEAICIAFLRMKGYEYAK